MEPHPAPYHTPLSDLAEQASTISVIHVTRAVPFVHADTPVIELVDGVLIPLGERALPVREAGEVIGIVSLQDAAWAHLLRATTLVARDIMTPWQRVVSLDASATIADASSAFETEVVDHLPVLDLGRLIGMVHRVDVNAWQRLHSTP